MACRPATTPAPPRPTTSTSAESLQSKASGRSTRRGAVAAADRAPASVPPPRSPLSLGIDAPQQASKTVRGQIVSQITDEQAAADFRADPDRPRNRAEPGG